MRALALVMALLLAGCAVNPGPRAMVESCNAEVDRLSALLAAETAERQRLARVATRREEALRRQLEAMKSIERGILERERVRSEPR